MPQNYTAQAKSVLDTNFLNSSSQNRAFFQGVGQGGFDIAREAMSRDAVLPGYRLVQVSVNENNFKILMMCDVNQEVILYVDCRLFTEGLLRSKPLVQLTLWRTMDPRYDKVMAGVPTGIFQNYLLERYDIVAGDLCQANEGRPFWVKQMLLAQYSGRYVYRYDRRVLSLRLITDKDDITANGADLWGDDESYRNILAVISKHGLSFA